MHKNIKRFFLSLIFLFATRYSFSYDESLDEFESLRTEAFQEVSPNLTPPIVIDENLTLAKVVYTNILR